MAIDAAAVRGDLLGESKATLRPADNPPLHHTGPVPMQAFNELGGCELSQGVPKRTRLTSNSSASLASLASAAA